MPDLVKLLVVFALKKWHCDCDGWVTIAVLHMLGMAMSLFGGKTVICYIFSSFFTLDIWLLLNTKNLNEIWPPSKSISDYFLNLKKDTLWIKMLKNTAA